MTQNSFESEAEDDIKLRAKNQSKLQVHQSVKRVLNFLCIL